MDVQCHREARDHSKRDHRKYFGGIEMREEGQKEQGMMMHIQEDSEDEGMQMDVAGDARGMMMLDCEDDVGGMMDIGGMDIGSDPPGCPQAKCKPPATVKKLHKNDLLEKACYLLAKKHGWPEEGAKSLDEYYIGETVSVYSNSTGLWFNDGRVQEMAASSKGPIKAVLVIYWNDKYQKWIMRANSKLTLRPRDVTKSLDENDKLLRVVSA